MVTLQEILFLVGYSSKEMQLSFIKLLAYRDCFSKPTLIMSDEKISQAAKDRRKCALEQWQKLSLEESYPKHLDTIIDTSEAEKFLTVTFPSFEEGFEWLLNITQLKFLRESFDFEGLGKDKESTGVNLARYNPKDELSIVDLERKFDKNSNEFQLYQLVKKLGLIDEVTIPKLNKKIKYFIIHGCVEKFAKNRVYFLESVMKDLENDPSKERIHISYTTNPRGLFNDEESLAPLLAEQFKRSDKTSVSAIQGVLDRNKRSKKIWTQNLTELKQEILTAVGEEKWPETPNSFYYKNADKYEKRARLEGRESLKDWPCAMDMIYYHFRQLSAKYPNAFKKIDFIEVIGSGKNGKIANTEDLTQAWIDQIGKGIIPPEFLVFISDNVTHAIENQRMIAEPLFHEQLKNIYFICAGPKADRFSIATALDMLTKTLYALKPRIRERITLIDDHSSSLPSPVPSLSLSLQTKVNKPLKSTEDKACPSSSTQYSFRLSPRGLLFGGSILCLAGFFACKLSYSKDNSNSCDNSFTK